MSQQNEIFVASDEEEFNQDNSGLEKSHQQSQKNQSYEQNNPSSSIQKNSILDEFDDENNDGEQNDQKNQVPNNNKSQQFQNKEVSQSQIQQQEENKQNNENVEKKIIKQRGHIGLNMHGHEFFIILLMGNLINQKINVKFHSELNILELECEDIRILQDEVQKIQKNLDKYGLFLIFNEKVDKELLNEIINRAKYMSDKRQEAYYIITKEEYRNLYKSMKDIHPELRQRFITLRETFGYFVYFICKKSKVDKFLENFQLYVLNDELGDPVFSKEKRILQEEKLIQKLENNEQASIVIPSQKDYYCSDQHNILDNITEAENSQMDITQTMNQTQINQVQKQEKIDQNISQQNNQIIDQENEKLFVIQQQKNEKSLKKSQKLQQEEQKIENQLRANIICDESQIIQDQNIENSGQIYQEDNFQESEKKQKKKKKNKKKNISKEIELSREKENFNEEIQNEQSNILDQSNSIIDDSQLRKFMDPKVKVKDFKNSQKQQYQQQQESLNDNYQRISKNNKQNENQLNQKGGLRDKNFYSQNQQYQSQNNHQFLGNFEQEQKSYINQEDQLKNQSVIQNLNQIQESQFLLNDNSSFLDHTVQIQKQSDQQYQNGSFNFSIIDELNDQSDSLGQRKRQKQTQNQNFKQSNQNQNNNNNQNNIIEESVFNNDDQGEDNFFDPNNKFSNINPNQNSYTTKQMINNNQEKQLKQNSNKQQKNNIIMEDNFFDQDETFYQVGKGKKVIRCSQKDYQKQVKKQQELIEQQEKDKKAYEEYQKKKKLKQQLYKQQRLEQENNQLQQYQKLVQQQQQQQQQQQIQEQLQKQQKQIKQQQQQQQQLLEQQNQDKKILEVQTRQANKQTLEKLKQKQLQYKLEQEQIKRAKEFQENPDVQFTEVYSDNLDQSYPVIDPSHLQMSEKQQKKKYQQCQQKQKQQSYLQQQNKQSKEGMTIQELAKLDKAQKNKQFKGLNTLDETQYIQNIDLGNPSHSQQNDSNNENFYGNQGEDEYDDDEEEEEKYEKNEQISNLNQDYKYTVRQPKINPVDQSFICNNLYISANKAKKSQKQYKIYQQQKLQQSGVQILEQSIENDKSKDGQSSPNESQQSFNQNQSVSDYENNLVKDQLKQNMDNKILKRPNKYFKFKKEFNYKLKNNQSFDFIQFYEFFVSKYNPQDENQQPIFKHKIDEDKKQLNLNIYMKSEDDFNSNNQTIQKLVYLFLYDVQCIELSRIEYLALQNLDGYKNQIEIILKNGGLYIDILKGELQNNQQKNDVSSLYQELLKQIYKKTSIDFQSYFLFYWCQFGFEDKIRVILQDNLIDNILRESRQINIPENININQINLGNDFTEKILKQLKCNDELIDSSTVILIDEIKLNKNNKIFKFNIIIDIKQQSQNFESNNNSMNQNLRKNNKHKQSMGQHNQQKSQKDINNQKEKIIEQIEKLIIKEIQ